MTRHPLFHYEFRVTMRYVSETVDGNIVNGPEFARTRYYNWRLNSKRAIDLAWKLEKGSRKCAGTEVLRVELVRQIKEGSGPAPDTMTTILLPKGAFLA